MQWLNENKICWCERCRAPNPRPQPPSLHLPELSSPPNRGNPLHLKVSSQGGMWGMLKAAWSRTTGEGSCPTLGLGPPGLLWEGWLGLSDRGGRKGWHTGATLSHHTHAHSYTCVCSFHLSWVSNKDLLLLQISILLLSLVFGKIHFLEQF